MKKSFDRKRPLSWSAISSFKWDPEQWYKKYVLGHEDPPSLEMQFGNFIGNKLAKDPTFLPEVPRYSKFEKKFNVEISGIPLVGFLDSYCPDTKNFHEYKTASSITKWNHKSVQEHGQLLMYKLFIWIIDGKKPEDIKCHLTYIPVRKTGNFKKGFSMELSDLPIKTFEAKHTSAQVLAFANDIKKVYKQMIKYCENHD